MTAALTGHERVVGAAAVVCPACEAPAASDALHPFYRLRRQPVFVGVAYPDAAMARRAPVGDIELTYCEACGIVFNARYDARLVDYRPGYDASLTHSATFRMGLEQIVGDLAERYELRGRRVLEIGCGAGHVLRMLAERTGCEAVGVDPAAPFDGTEAVGAGSVRLIQSCFDEAHATPAPAVVLCLDVFEQIPRPLELLRALRRGLGNRRDVGVLFLTPHREHVFDEAGGWSVYYEQRCHFDEASLSRLFIAAGFEVVSARRCPWNPQSQLIEARPGEAGVPDAPRPGLPASLASFAERQGERVAAWNGRLAAWAAMGKRVVLWGSGGKGLNFLNTIGSAASIAEVVDVNPLRQGKFLPTHGQRIAPPASLRERRVDVAIVSNPLWRHEVEAQLDAMGVRCEVYGA